MTTSRSCPIVLDHTTCIVVAPSEPYSVQRAAQAVAEDICEAGGALPRVLSQDSPDAGLAILVESDGRTAAAHGFAAVLQPEESFIIRMITHQGRDAILISSCGELGAIHGLYCFSETHLGTDPFKHWTGYRPPPRDPIVLGSVDFDSGAPPFRFRGWHVEWIQVLPQDWNCADPERSIRAYWEIVFETLLRCRGNMVKPETNVPDSPEVALAQKMGLLITQEHACPFGVGMWEIKSDDPGFDYSFDRYPDVYLRAWEAALARYPRPDRVIWTLAFRGLGDRPFWGSDPTYDTDAKRGALITRVLHKQKELIQRRLGHLNPPMIFNTWMEGNRLFVQGDIRPPDGTYVVWADNGYGTFRAMIAEGCNPEQVCDILPAQPAGGRHGVYYHVSMWDYQTPFLTQFVPLERIQQQFTRVMDKQSTAYLLVNVGRVRDCVHSVAALADLWQNPRQWTDSASPGENCRPKTFRHAWCARHFGPVADLAAKCYEDLYRIPFQWGEWGGWEDYTVGDVGYIRRAAAFVRQALCAEWRSPQHLPQQLWLNKALPLREQLAYMRGKTSATAPQWEAAQKRALAVAAKLEGPARDFFECDVLSQIEIHAFCNLYLQNIIEAVDLYDQGKFAAVPEKARAALHCVEQWRAALRRREYGRWRNWNTVKLLHVACVPLAWHIAELLIQASEGLSIRWPVFDAVQDLDNSSLPQHLR